MTEIWKRRKKIIDLRTIKGVKYYNWLLMTLQEAPLSKERNCFCHSRFPELGDPHSYQVRSMEERESDLGHRTVNTKERSGGEVPNMVHHSPREDFKDHHCYSEYHNSPPQQVLMGVKTTNEVRTQLDQDIKGIKCTGRDSSQRQNLRERSSLARRRMRRRLRMKPWVRESWEDCNRVYVRITCSTG